MSPQDHYRASSGAGGKRGWRVIYIPDTDDAARHYELVDRRGHIVRFGSYRSAAIRATKLNWADQPPTEAVLGGTFWRMPII